MSIKKNGLRPRHKAFCAFIEAMHLPKHGFIYGTILIAVLIIAANFPMMNDEAQLHCVS